MRSPAQIEASRRNGARSLGPVSPEGKARSSQNAITHGLSSAKIILPEGEAREEFLEIRAGLVARFQPSDAVEGRLVHEMATALWRKSYFFSLEIAALGTDAPDAGSLAQSLQCIVQRRRELEYLLRYQTQAERSFQRSLQTLLLLQKQKMPNEPEPAPPDSQPDPEPGPVPEPESDPDPGEPAEPSEPRRYYLVRLPSGPRACENSSFSPRRRRRIGANSHPRGNLRRTAARSNTAGRRNSMAL